MHFKKDENIFLISLFKHNINYICYTGINDRNEMVSFQFRISNNLQSSNYRIKKAIAGVTKKSDPVEYWPMGQIFTEKTDSGSVIYDK